MKEIVLLVMLNNDPARTRPWGWKGHCRVLKFGVFLKTGVITDDKIVQGNKGDNFGYHVTNTP